MSNTKYKILLLAVVVAVVVAYVFSTVRDAS